MLPAYGPLSPTNWREGAAVRLRQRYLILGLALTVALPSGSSSPPPGGGRLQLRRWGHRMCAGHGPRCGRGAKGRDSGRPLSVRERLVLRHRLGSRRRLGSRVPAEAAARSVADRRDEQLPHHPSTTDEGAECCPPYARAPRKMGAIGAGVIAGATLFGTASDGPAAASSADCTAAELAHVMSGVTPTRRTT